MRLWDMLAFFVLPWYNTRMSKKSLEAKSFPIRFSPIIIILCVAIILLCCAGVALSADRIAKEGINGLYSALKSPFLIAICLFGIAVVIAMLIKSQYVVDGDKLITQFGFVKSTFEIKKFTSMIFDTERNKLSIYMGEEYFVLTVQMSFVNELVNAILAANENIDYSFTLSGEPKDEDKKENDDKKDEE